ncbi:MAG: hypothetical protein K2X41_09475 [Hyphomicrobium sp.]|nr:hypothetical protein [Hyphomicrobium sp.]
MLKLSQDQWDELQVRDTHQFVESVCDQFLSNRQDMVSEPGRDAIRERMQNAFDYAVDIGFKSTPHIVRLLYLAADAPGIHDDPLINGYLRKPGATPEQRLDDMLVVIDKKLEEAH